MLPQLDPTWYASQSFWMLITFCTMFLVIWRFVMPAMRATVDARRSRIENDIKKTDELKTEAARLLKELEQTQASVKEQTQAALAKAQEEAQALTKQMETDFARRLAAHIAEKEQTLNTAKEKALQDIAAISGSLTDQITRKVAGIAVSADEIKQKTASVMEKTI